jgi:hypothetical protein
MLGQNAIDPDDFSGEWYSSQEQCIYHFSEGMIQCQKYPIPLSDNDYISGAYSFSKNSVFLFAEGIDGLESPREVFLVKNADECLLCENKDGSGRIYFIRDNRSK